MRTNRRTFLKTTVTNTAIAVSSVVATPVLIPARSLGRENNVPPSERVIMGLIGCGDHGRGWNLPLMFQNPLQQVVAVCDVDQPRMEQAQNLVNSFYNEKNGRNDYDCSVHPDFRDVLNRKDIDAVCIVTPDHWHVLMSVAAMKAGKDVICEKPTLTVEEGRILSDTQKKTGAVFQTASENRSIDEYQRLVELVRNGQLGELRNIKVLLPPGLVDKGKIGGSFEISEVPETLDYEKWIGPAPMKPYIPARLHYNWRWNLDYSGGSITDWGAHLINLAQWANETDETGPVEVCGKGDYPDFGEVWNATPTFDVQYRYKNGVKMRVWSEVPGIKFEGTKGWVLNRGWRGTTTASDDALLSWQPGEGDLSLTRKSSVVGKSGPSPITGLSMGGEHVDFSECVKSRQPCYYTAEGGHRNHTIAHIANVSMKMSGATLSWDPEQECFSGEGAEEANRSMFLRREQREPWTFAHVDSWINLG